MKDHLNVEHLPKDVYRVSKDNLLHILRKFDIKYRENDTVADIRPIVADLKAYLKNNLTEEKKHILKKLIGNKTYLSDGEIAKYPGLARIQQYLKDRENLYDFPAENNSAESDYEDIIFPLDDLDDEFEQDQLEDRKQNPLLPLGQEQQVVNGAPLGEGSGFLHLPHSSHSTLSNFMPTNMSKEKLPLISAGTYHGLPSENPNDFIDKYDIAATSNYWTENTKLNLFPAHLAGTALSWYRHFSKDREVNNWNNLKSIFIQTFTPAAQTQTLQSILERKVQGRDQPVLSYFLEILTLCRRHDPDTTDKQIIQYVIQGLRPEFCDRILNETCDTLDQLERNLKKIELQIEIRSQNREKYKRAESVGVPNNGTDNYNHELSTLQAEIKNLTQIVSNLSVQQVTTQQSQPHNNKQGAHRGYNLQRGRSYRGPPTYRPNYQYTPPVEWSPRPTVYRGGYQPQYRQQWNPRGQMYAPRPQAAATTTYCSICKRNNHNTKDCRYRKPQAAVSTQKVGKYCDHCKMTNHSREECYKLTTKPGNSKNA